MGHFWSYCFFNGRKVFANHDLLVKLGCHLGSAAQTHFAALLVAERQHALHLFGQVSRVARLAQKAVDPVIHHLAAAYGIGGDK
jgi:hypothetical protein